MNKSLQIRWYKRIITVIALAYLLSGFYSTESGQTAMVLRFGKLVKLKTEPGISYSLPAPFEKIMKVRVKQVNKIMLESDRKSGVEDITGDENMIEVRAVINFDVKDPVQYLFNVGNPSEIIESVSKRYLSGELAQRAVDDIMTSEKSVLKIILKNKIQQKLDELHAGVRIISIEFTDIVPPSNVSHAFKAVSDAREKKQRIMKEAEGYANTVIPKSRGEAVSIISSANAYAKEIVDKATSDTSAFTALCHEYRQQPEITARLRYLESMQRIFNRAKIIIDSDPKNSIYYIDKDSKPDLNGKTPGGKREG